MMRRFSKCGTSLQSPIVGTRKCTASSTPANMKPEGIPADVTLRDHLLRRIEGSTALHVGLTICKGREKDDDKKTYQELLNIMKRYIARIPEDKNMAARGKFANITRALASLLRQLPNLLLLLLIRRTTGPRTARTISLLLLWRNPRQRRLPRTARIRMENPVQDLVLRKSRRRSVTSTSTRATASMVTNVLTVIFNIIGRVKTEEVRAKVRVDRLEDRKLPVGRRTIIVMVG